MNQELVCSLGWAQVCGVFLLNCHTWHHLMKSSIMWGFLPANGQSGQYSTWLYIFLTPKKALATPPSRALWSTVHKWVSNTRVTKPEKLCLSLRTWINVDDVSCVRDDRCGIVYHTEAYSCTLQYILSGMPAPPTTEEGCGLTCAMVLCGVGGVEWLIDTVTTCDTCYHCKSLCMHTQ